MKHIYIPKSEIRRDHYRGSGSGGQHRNKTDSCVRLTHLPTGKTASCCEHREQLKNYRVAKKRLERALEVHFSLQERLKPDRAPSVVVREYHEPDGRVRDFASDATFDYRDVVGKPPGYGGSDISEPMKAALRSGRKSERRSGRA